MIGEGRRERRLKTYVDSSDMDVVAELGVPGTSEGVVTFTS